MRLLWRGSGDWDHGADLFAVQLAVLPEVLDAHAGVNGTEAIQEDQEGP